MATMHEIRSFVIDTLINGDMPKKAIKTQKEAKEWMDKLRNNTGYPKGMQAVDFKYIFNHAVGTDPEHIPSDLEIRANALSIPFHKSLDNLECAFLSDHVLPYMDHVISIFYRYNHVQHDQDWCAAVYTFDTADHSGDGMCTLRQILYQCFDDPGCAMKVAIHIADSKNY